MEEISAKLGKPMEKIRNWFKHQRNREVIQGKRKFLVYNRNSIFAKPKNLEKKFVFERKYPNSERGI